MRKFSNKDLFDFRFIGRSVLKRFFIFTKIVFCRVFVNIKTDKASCYIIDSHSNRSDQRLRFNHFLKLSEIDACEDVSYISYGYSFAPFRFISRLFTLIRKGFVELVRQDISCIFKDSMFSDARLYIFNESILEVYLICEAMSPSFVTCGQHASYVSFTGKFDQNNLVYFFSYSDRYLLQDQKIIDSYSICFENRSVSVPEFSITSKIFPLPISLTGLPVGKPLSVLFLRGKDFRCQNLAEIKALRASARFRFVVICHPSDSRFNYFPYLSIFVKKISISDIGEAFCHEGTMCEYLRFRDIEGLYVLRS